MDLNRPFSRLAALALVASLMTLCSDSLSNGNAIMSQVFFPGKVNAPDFPKGLAWLNTARPVSLNDLRGKVVLLDFWTYCCINCMHVIPELKKLEQKYARELVVVGVHSAKFTTEQGTQNIREAVLRYGIEHPVVNDKDFAVWNSYAVNAWPTFILIDPEGKVIAKHSGEGIFQIFDELIGKVVEEFDSKGTISRVPLKFAREKETAPKSLFSYPGKITTDGTGKRLFITDSNHNRIVVLSLPDYSVVETIGSGEEGFKDGSSSEAMFNRPQGIICRGDVLYVADTENHAVRKIDLTTKTVVTLAGGGTQAREPNVSGVGTRVSLNSPWDLLEHDGVLYVAMAGPHQIWTIDLRTLNASPYAGSGREDIIDGKLRSAALAQPSGITTDGTRLYFADSEVSAVRSADLQTGGEVRTIVGAGLFEYGDTDGVGSSVRLQHPIGITFHDGMLYVADTYNSKIKRLDPHNKMCETLIGTGEPGATDGGAREAQLKEPNGLVIVGGKMYITDTNNHLIRIYDFATRRLATLIPKGAEKLAPPRRAASSYGGQIVTIPEQHVRTGKGVIRLDLSLPNGFKWNAMAPFYVGLFPSDGKIVTVADSLAERNLENPPFPLEIPTEFRAGRTSLDVDLVVYYCEAKTENVCLVKQLRVVVPVSVEEGGKVSVVSVNSPIK
jgi:DNA-binding beta-propeller fold protein YncE